MDPAYGREVRNRTRGGAVPLPMRTVRVLGASLLGTRAELVTVEARFEARDRERTEIVVTGLPDPVIRESRGRLASALAENRVRLPPGRLFLNLVPAARPKSGAILDLPLALGAAGAGGHLPARSLAGRLFLGEVGIDGALHGVPGGLAAALAARDAGVARLVAPTATAEEAACLPGLDVRGARHLAQVFAHLTGADDDPLGAPLEPRPAPPPAEDPGSLLAEVRGQEVGKHALLVAAAGGHALLMVGPPGSGKSMLARRLIHLLPAPSLEERLEITGVLSAVGRWPGGLARARPLRAPHHTTSHAGLVGGGARALPGEVTLAHGGVLFLDELPEFRREALESLREPLDTGRILLARAERHVELPARVQLVAAMNPCPCGFLGHGRVPCTCPPRAVERYRRRISGPLLDRIDLRVELVPPTADELLDPPDRRGGPVGTPSRQRVEAAVAKRRERGQDASNAALEGDELDRCAALDAEGRALLERATRRQALSARAVQSLRRVARTLADLDGDDRPSARHLAQALALRGALRA